MQELNFIPDWYAKKLKKIKMSIMLFVISVLAFLEFFSINSMMDKKNEYESECCRLTNLENTMALNKNNIDRIYTNNKKDNTTIDNFVCLNNYLLDKLKPLKMCVNGKDVSANIAINDIDEYEILIKCIENNEKYCIKNLAYTKKDKENYMVDITLTEK